MMIREQTLKQNLQTSIHLFFEQRKGKCTKQAFNFIFTLLFNILEKLITETLHIIGTSSIDEFDDISNTIIQNIISHDAPTLAQTILVPSNFDIYRKYGFLVTNKTLMEYIIGKRVCKDNKINAGPISRVVNLTLALLCEEFGKGSVGVERYVRYRVVKNPELKSLFREVLDSYQSFGRIPLMVTFPDSSDNPFVYDTLSVVVSFVLDLNEFVQMRLVCKAWNNIIASRDYFTLWKYIMYNTIVTSPLFPLCKDQSKFTIEFMESRVNADRNTYMNWQTCFSYNVQKIVAQAREYSTIYNVGSYGAATLFLKMGDTDDIYLKRKGATKWGGSPDVPPDFTYNASMGSFVAQINLSDLKTTFIHGGHWPDTGLLLFFTGVNRCYISRNSTDELEAKCVYYNGDLNLLMSDTSVPCISSSSSQYLLGDMNPSFSCAFNHEMSTRRIRWASRLSNKWKASQRPQGFTHALFCRPLDIPEESGYSPIPHFTTVENKLDTAFTFIQTLGELSGSELFFTRTLEGFTKFQSISYQVIKGNELRRYFNANE
jgi:hypothetical protein